MEKISVNRGLLIGVVAVAIVSLLALGFLLGRESGSGSVSAPRTSIERVAPRAQDGPPPLPASSSVLITEHPETRPAPWPTPWTQEQGAALQIAASPVPAPVAGVPLGELHLDLGETRRALEQLTDGLLQRRPHPDAGTYLGSGKAVELADLVAAVEADTVIVDGDLAPSQRRALEDIVKVKVIDRTALILDIFAQHARSKEGKAQVELAQLEYLLPRLRGWGESMSRQAGGRVAAGAGIGSRGPGETKIELDRRRIRSRVALSTRQRVLTWFLFSEIESRYFSRRKK